MYEYTLTRNTMAKDRFESLKCCRNLSIAGEISSILGTIGSIALSTLEETHTLGKDALTVLTVGGIVITIINAKEIYHNNKLLKNMSIYK